MSHTSPEGSSEGSEEFDLNIAPVIDCLTVLIAYLLVSVSFLSLAVLDVGVAVSGEAPTPDEALPKEPPLSLVIQLAQPHQVVLKLTGGAKNLHLTVPLPSNGATRAFDFDKLKLQLDQIKQKYPSLSDVSVAAEGTVVYKDMVKAIETIKPDFPKVFISGENVSL